MKTNHISHDSHDHTHGMAKQSLRLAFFRATRSIETDLYREMIDKEQSLIT